MHAELVQDRCAREALGVLAVGAVLERLVEEIGRALEHLADDREALGGICVEDGRWGEGIADEGEFPSKVELVRDGRLW